MASGTAGDRKWGAARRGSMTVLGKVAVPKPINLPSQRLENHGLDPNVEIVPKGTLSWGSRSSASTPNAWGSSMLSPSADSSTNSPSHHSARPSSGESGTRPSTAGSDRALDSTNAWGSNSRPSSASGALSSSQTSLASLRPRSAETRPGSSQLSRFAESVLDNSVAGGIERLGPTSSKNDRFSLSSGDFPVLGSEKNGCGRSAGSQEHAPQGSELSSDTVVSVKEGDSSVNADPRNRVENSWRRDNAPCGEDGGPGADKWRGDHPPHQNAGILPQQFSAWHGPLVNNPPGGVWFRGPPGGPPYGAPVAPGGFPVEPFSYYRPQIPPPALPTLQPPGAGPRGHHSTSGDMYRPQMPDGFIRPGMPLRPGFYSGPMPYDGYFGPPMNYHNSNERDIAYTGMAAGPPRYPGQNAPEIPHRSGGYGSTNKASDGEEVDMGHPHNTRGQYKVLLKQQESWDGKDEGHKREGSVTKDESSLDKGEPGKKALSKNHWRSDRNNEEKDLENAGPVEEASQKIDYKGGGPGPTRVKALENVQRADDADSARGPYKNSVVPEAPKSSVAAPKDSSLIQKIEGLNAKARVSDDRHEYTFVSNRSEEDNNFQGPDTMSRHSAKEIGSDALHVERIHVGKVTKPNLSEMDAPSGGKSLEQADVSESTISRRYLHGVQGKSHHRGKGRSSTQDVDERGKRSKEPDQLVVVPDASLEISNIHAPHRMSGKANDICTPLYRGKDEGATVSIAYDPSESEAERAKMKELAKQRVKQRQVEEEERARDQKAKADMKLEELNRRAQAVDGSIGKGENVSTGATLKKQHNLQPIVEMTKASARSVVLSSQSVSSAITVSEVSDGIGRSTVRSNLSQEPPDGACKEHALVGNQSRPLKQDTKTGGASDPIEDGRMIKQTRVGSKHKSHISLEKNFNEKGTLEPSKVLADGADSVTKSADVPYESTPSCEDRIPVNPHGMVESMVQQRRKGNKISRNKHKVDESSSLSALPVLASKEIIAANTIEESSQLKSPESNLDSTQVMSPPDSGDAKHPSERYPATAGEEVHTRVNYQRKSQHSRRMPKNQHANKLHGSESVVWAPVRSQNKAEVSDEASDRALVEGINSTVKIDNPVQNNPKNKRAEIERYVPKPAAKEMAQQGSVHQHTVALSSINSGDVSVEAGGGSGPQSIENAQPAKPSSRNGDGRLNKPGRAHGSWRQRGPKESTLHVLADGQSYTADIGKDGQKLSGHHQAEEHELRSMDEKPKRSDEQGSGDGSNLPCNSNSTAEVPIHPARDQGVAGRGKRHAFRAQKAPGVTVDHDQKKSIEEMDESRNQSLAPEVIQRSPVVPKENHVVSERSTSHWQPKSHSSSAHISRGSRVTGGQNIQADSGGIDAELPHGGLPASAQHEMEHQEALSTNDNRKYNSRKDNVNEAGHVEGKIETKALAFGVRGHSSIQGPVRSTGDVRHESQFPSGFHKNQGGRNARGSGPHGDWNSSGPENNRHRERQRPNSHFRYQPVGTYSDNRSNQVEGSKDGSQSAGMKFKEKGGQGSSRRGGENYTDRQVGTGRADADCN
ncbi:protein MODIFIER OF SNC1 1 isoform X1 [Syzygium oleosum]|uniref:protein MODIFIER OF SNC1 1 isoform X1 n=1 Tax=Syzygium oleosum TaxID=219896 RepID=UPI0024BA88CE|nr:protein MODIFIER OF SNC1 1 isoform X1 [Syzygium oleosum]